MKTFAGTLLHFFHNVFGQINFTFRGSRLDWLAQTSTSSDTLWMNESERWLRSATRPHVSGGHEVLDISELLLQFYPTLCIQLSDWCLEKNIFSQSESTWNSSWSPVFKLCIISLVVQRVIALVMSLYCFGFFSYGAVILRWDFSTFYCVSLYFLTYEEIDLT